MMTLPTVFDKRLKAAVPSRSAWLEAWGFLLLGVGLYLALACYSFSPFDYGPKGLNPRGVSNMAGPYGAYAASHILGRFGIIGMVWPVTFLAWGALTATGFVILPRPRRLLGMLALAVDLAGFATVLLPRTTLPEPSFGFGGIVGHMLKASLMPQMGFGGTIIALSVLGVVAMVLTGNFTVMRTAGYVQDGYYATRRVSRKAGKKAAASVKAKVWNEWILNQDPETLKAAQQAAVAGTVARTSTSTATDIVVEPTKKRVAPKVDPEAADAKAVAPKLPGIDMEIFYEGPAHGKPEASLFTRTKKAPDRSKDFKVISDNLVTQLAEFKINGEINTVTQGPVVTTFEFKPAPGTKVSKISALGEDLARLLKAQSLRVLAPIPGKDTVGFEVPNAERAVIGFADLIESKEFKSTKRKLPIAMGVDIFGNPVIEDLAEMPHLLVAGSTGSGKSVFMNTLVGSLIARHSAATLRFVMIDPKMVEMAAYNTLPHMACPVITDPATEARQVLARLVTEMDDRYMRMRAVGARNIDSFNEIVKTRRKGEFKEFEGRWAAMPYIVLIIDEMADMMMILGKDAEMPITRLAQKARACGIHMVIATQRPSADVVTGLIKANFPTRVAFRVLSGIDSRTILDQSGAEGLLGKGDMLYLASGGANRLHGAYLSEGEVHSMVSATSTKRK